MALHIERPERTIGSDSVIHVERERLEVLDRILEELRDLYADSVTQEEIDSTGSVYHRMKELEELLRTVGLALKDRDCFDDPEPAMRKAEVQRVMHSGHRLYLAIYCRLLFLKGAKTLTKERERLLEDIDVIEAAVPTTEQLERVERNRRYLQRSIEWKMGQIERARALRNRGKTFQIKPVA